jgi:hypothetical protein
MPAANSSARVPHRHVWSGVLGRSGFGIAMALLLFTALIWLRLRLVTDVPRQAYAQPKGQASSHAEPAPAASRP